MTTDQHDDLRFDIELALRGVGYRHRRRLKPRIRSEEEAHTLAGRVADKLRARYRIVRKSPLETSPAEASWNAPPAAD